MKSILEEAEHIVSGDRAGDYGENSLPSIARLWSEHVGKDITARDVAWMMVLLKSVRDRHKAKRDNLVDSVGYLQLAEVNAPDPTESRVEVCEWEATEGPDPSKPNSDFVSEEVTYDRLGEEQKIHGVVYEDHCGDLWTWNGRWLHSLRMFEPPGWCSVAGPPRSGPFTRTDLTPREAVR